MLVEKHPSSPEPKPVAATDLSFVDKSKFLMQGDAYRPPVPEVIRRETHMSEVFLAGDRVYKLKKPVRFPYLDFSTLARREAACRAELELNRRLAPDVYRGVVPLVRAAHGLAIGGPGEVVDWLVVMNRLDETQMLDRVPSQDLKVLVTGILVQKETGGNLAEILDRTAGVIRERLRIQGEIRTHTAQGRMTGWILCSLPVVMLFMINLINPGYSDVLLNTRIGHMLIAVGIALLITGAMIIRHIINGIEV